MTKQNDKQVVTIDANRLTMREFEAFSKNSNDTTAMRELIAKIATGWDYEGDFNDPEAYAELTVPQFMQVAREAGQQIQAALKGGN